jgi:hypothetical protein
MLTSNKVLPSSAECYPGSYEYKRARKREREADRRQKRKLTDATSALLCLQQSSSTDVADFSRDTTKHTGPSTAKVPKHGEEGYHMSVQAAIRKRNVERGLTWNGQLRVLQDRKAWTVEGLGQLQAYDFGALPRTLPSVRQFMSNTVEKFLSRLQTRLVVDYQTDLIPKFMDKSRTMHAYVFYHGDKANIMGIVIYEVRYMPRYERKGIFVEVLATLGGLPPDESDAGREPTIKGVGTVLMTWLRSFGMPLTLQCFPERVLFYYRRGFTSGDHLLDKAMRRHQRGTTFTLPPHVDRDAKLWLTCANTS